MVSSGENMIIPSRILKSKLTKYKNKNNKINRLIKEGKIYRIKNGLFETDKNTPGYLLASSIYGPSYISFEYALSCYGFIPERVTTVTCASFDKKKKKMYDTYFGVFTYRDIPKKAYPYEVLLQKEGNYSYQIATKEKALCDKLYTLDPIHNYADLENMLFNDLRIDEEAFDTLDINIIKELSELYNSTNIKLLYRYIKKKHK